MARGSIERRLARLQRQADLVLARHQRPIPDAPTIMRESGFEPDDWQIDVLTSQHARVLMNCCRQSGKSTVTAALAVTEALHHASLVLLLSPSLRQSQELYRKVRMLYRPQAARVPIVQESALRLELCNGARIISLPGSEETVRGFSAVDLLCVDEASRVDDALFAAISPMLAISNGRMILLSTPAGQRGFFYQEWMSTHPWERVCIPASYCPRIRSEFLQQERLSMPPYVFQQEYECQFMSRVEGGIFSEWTIHKMFDDDAVEAWDFSDILPVPTGAWTAAGSLADEEIFGFDAEDGDGGT
jgi:Terminase large subunit, T4likevirus-type, N-terminal